MIAQSAAEQFYTTLSGLVALVILAVLAGAVIGIALRFRG